LSVVWGSLVPLIVLGVSACDDDILLVEPSDVVFSIFGYLDPGSDTQWVRVSPLRTTTLTFPDPIDAVVTIEDLGTGRTIDMIPTLFWQISGEFDERRYAHNFTTTEALDPLSTYRLTARRSDGKTSSALARIPRGMLEFPVTVGIPQAGSANPSFYVQFPMEATDHLPMVSLMYDPPDRLVIGNRETTECRIHGISSLYVPLNGSFDPESEMYFLNFRPGTTYPIDPPCNERGEWTIRIVRSVEPWPFDATASNLSLSGYSNIENGIGFLGGIVTRRIPLDRCDLSGPGRPEVCQMHYGPGSVRLSILPANGWEYDPHFLPNGTIKRVDQSWSRASTRLPEWNSQSPILHFPGLVPGTYRIRLVHGALCEDRNIALAADDDRMVVIEMGPPAPGETLNADNCRERPL
jgi:hypothetical protein